MTEKSKPTFFVAEVAPEDGRVPEWVMVARTGTWLGHPTGQAEVITANELAAAVAYYERNYAAHDTDLVIDYHHASVGPAQGSGGAPAAGWITNLVLRANDAELWGSVLWTAAARDVIGKREYRYLSPALLFGAPDPVTGNAVPMRIHSVALTNTPFMTELQALNEATASGGAAPIAGGTTMSLLQTLAKAAGQTPEEMASGLGLAADAADGAVAMAVKVNAARVSELDVKVNAMPPLAKELANHLGLPLTASETDVRAAVIRLRAPGAGMAAVKRTLGLAETVDEPAVLNAITGLQTGDREAKAAALVDGAIQAGRIPPAHRDFYLAEAGRDFAAAQLVINGMPVLTAAAPAAGSGAAQSVAISNDEKDMAAKLGLTHDQMLTGREDYVAPPVAQGAGGS